jgi:DNA-binding PadR family transcriptional regulator
MALRDEVGLLGAEVFRAEHLAVGIVDPFDAGKSFDSVHAAHCTVIAAGLRSDDGDQLQLHSELKIIRFRMKSLALDSSRHLPLRPAAFAVLAALAKRPLHGIDVLDEVNATVMGRKLLGPGTLYRLMRELRQIGFIERAEDDDAPDRDERKTLHVLTPLGRAVLRAEVGRLQRTIKLARAVLAVGDR